MLFAAMIVPAVAGEPGDSALVFLEGLKTDGPGPAELLDETALSPHCGELRRREISQRLSRQGRHFRINR
ncbi:MAG: hypothetical protein GWO24_06635, partial [Akkermansiaceae bacterium]|nr:hypothetical protein [Akkermansiaceae bacterium]